MSFQRNSINMSGYIDFGFFSLMTISVICTSSRYFNFNIKRNQGNQDSTGNQKKVIKEQGPDMKPQQNT